jgi:hypothetical protein
VPQQQSVSSSHTAATATYAILLLLLLLLLLLAAQATLSGMPSAKALRLAPMPNFMRASAAV